MAEKRRSKPEATVRSRRKRLYWIVRLHNCARCGADYYSRSSYRSEGKSDEHGYSFGDDPSSARYHARDLQGCLTRHDVRRMI